jgi:hypothetical protein
MSEKLTRKEDLKPQVIEATTSFGTNHSVSGTGILPGSGIAGQFFANPVFNVHEAAQGVSVDAVAINLQVIDSQITPEQVSSLNLLNAEPHLQIFRDPISWINTIGISDADRDAIQAILSNPLQDLTDAQKEWILKIHENHVNGVFKLLEQTGGYAPQKSIVGIQDAAPRTQTRYGDISAYVELGAIPDEIIAKIAHPVQLGINLPTHYFMSELDISKANHPEAVRFYLTHHNGRMEIKVFEKGNLVLPPHEYLYVLLQQLKTYNSDQFQGLLQAEDGSILWNSSYMGGYFADRAKKLADLVEYTLSNGSYSSRYKQEMKETTEVTLSGRFGLVQENLSHNSAVGVNVTLRTVKDRSPEYIEKIMQRIAKNRNAV